MRMGIDLGGTKIEGVVLGPDGAELARRRVATPPEPYQAIVGAVVELVRALDGEVGGEATVGIGTPGSLSPESGLLRNANTVCLNGHPLDRDIASALGRPVRTANDANCFALSEATDGAALGADVVFGVIVGTGVGGGIVVGGRVLTGRNAIAGEWGHNPLPWATDPEQPGPACYCGKRGCLETWLSGRGLARDHAAAAPGSATDAVTVAARAEAGDASARAALDRWLDRMARALATVINVLDPDVVVLGGGLSNLAPAYQEIPRRWGAYVFSDMVRTRLLPPRFGDASGVRGAAWLW